MAFLHLHGVTGPPPGSRRAERRLPSRQKPRGRWARAERGRADGEPPRFPPVSRSLPARTGTRRRIYRAKVLRAAPPPRSRCAAARRGKRTVPSRSARASCENRTWRGKGAQNRVLVPPPGPNGGRWGCPGLLLPVNGLSAPKVPPEAAPEVLGKGPPERELSALGVLSEEPNSSKSERKPNRCRHEGRPRPHQRDASTRPRGSAPSCPRNRGRFAPFRPRNAPRRARPR